MITISELSDEGTIVNILRNFTNNNKKPNKIDNNADHLIFFESTPSTIKNAKYDPDETSNEFTNGYYIRVSEIFIIVFILLFWLLSLRKFTRNFDKIRTTHYREIPYKYKVKDVENINNVNITSSAKDGVIFTRDPINNLIHESKLYPYDIISNQNTASQSIHSFNQGLRNDSDESISRLHKKSLVLESKFIFNDFRDISK